MAKKLRIKIPSVLNSTLESGSHSKLEEVPDSKTFLEVERERPSAKNANETMPSVGSLLNPKGINGNTTTTPHSLIEKKQSSPSSGGNLPDPTPANPETIFHQRLCSEFSSAGKPLPTRKQSAAAWAMIPDDWEGFLEWLPTAEAFKTTRGAGGLPSLIDFYDADKERPAAMPAASQRSEVPTWTQPGPTKCLECADTGWKQIQRGDKTGVERCSCGARVKGQYESLGGVA